MRNGTSTFKQASIKSVCNLSPILLAPPPHPLTHSENRWLADVLRTSTCHAWMGLRLRLTFAVAGLQRPESLHQTAQVPVSAAAAYAQVKCNHQDTARLSADQRVRFLPVVSESTGAWDNNGSRTLRVIASAVAAREGKWVPRCTLSCRRNAAS